MSQKFGKYETNGLLRSGDLYQVYLAQHFDLQKYYYLKVEALDYPSQRRSAVAWEFDLLKNSDIAASLKPIHLIEEGHQRVGVYEFRQVWWLHERLKDVKLSSLTEKLQLAVMILRALQNIHIRQITLGDLSPGNILVDKESNEVLFIDFTRAQAPHHYSQRRLVQRISDDNLAYISPEQTGRLRRGIDHRSDLYSAGMLFYHFLNGRVPFECETPADYFHQHLTVNPPALSSIHPNIPEQVSKIIAKLSEKDPELRYFSAWGAVYDLEQCLADLKNNRPVQAFPLASKDVADSLSFPREVVGRSKEIEELKKALTPFFEEGQTGCLLLAGNSGVGKSTLIDELKAKFADESMLWITCNSEGKQAARPFEAIIQAFGGLVKRLLTLSEKELTYWRNTFREALGENGQLVIRLIPELELIIGKQMTPAELGPLEEQGRFELTLRQFLRSFSRSDHKLVLVIDDIQWIDEPSFNVIKSLMIRDGIENFLLIGAYKTDCHNFNFDLVTLGRELKAPHINFHFLRMSGFDQIGIVDFLKRSFAKDDSELIELAVILQEKTRGNPFFIKEFLRRAYDRGDIWFEKNDFIWNWNLSNLQSDIITDNTVSLVMEEIKSLSQKSIQVICTAACIGVRFRLDELLTIIGDDEKQVKAELLALCEKGLIIPNNEVSLNLLKFGEGFISNAIFIFSHPRIHEASLSILDKEEKNKIRFQLGVNQLSGKSTEQIQDNIYEIVDHLNCIEPPDDLKVRIAELNLQAAIKSRRSSAFQGAMKYLKRCADLLKGEGPWVNYYELTLNLFREVALVAFLMRDLETMNFAVVEVLRNARQLLDMVSVYEVKIQESMTRNMNEAIAIAQHVLRHFGIKIPKKPGMFHLYYHLLRSWLSIVGKDFVKKLENKPKYDDPIMEAAIRIGAKIGSAAYLAQPNLTPILVNIALLKGLKYGHVSSSAFAYSAFGSILISVFNRFDDAHRLGQFAIQLAKSFREKDQLCRVEHMVNTFFRPWRESVHLSLPGLLRAFRLGLESGEFEFACHAINVYGFYAFYVGVNLNKLDEELLYYRKTLDELNQYHLNNYTEMYRQGVLNLKLGSPHTYVLDGDSFREEEHRSFLGQAKDFTFYYGVLKLILAYSFDSDSHGMQFCKICQQFEDSARGSYAVPTYLFYEAMTRLRILQRKQTKMTWHYERRVLKILKLFSRWAKIIDINFKHRLFLLQAEWWRYRGKFEKAVMLYRQSLDLARLFDFAHEQALIAERYSDYLAERGMLDIAGFYRSLAIELYGQWGATKKSYQLNKTWEQAGSAFRNLNPKGSRELFDVDVMIKAISDIAAQTSHEALQEIILKNAISFAGADRGHLLLQNPYRDTLDLVQSSSLQDKLGLPITEVSDLCHAVVHFVARTLDSLVVGDAQLPNSRLPGLERDPYIARTMVRTLACIPLMIREGEDEKMVGMIYLENSQAANVFSKDRLQVTEMIGQIAASRFALALKANTLEASLKEAQLVQQALLPAKLGTRHFVVSDYYRAADHAGGDWFGFYEDKKRGRLYFLLGDVTGHGVSSSLVTGTAAGSAYSSLATMEFSSVNLSLEESIQVIAASVNRAVYDTAAKVSKMMTMVFVAIESQTGKGVYISAGHPAGCIIGRRKNLLLKPSGSPLGYRHDPSYQVEGFQLAAGESLFFYTDGLFENRGPDGRELRLRHVLKHLRYDLSPEQNRDLILQLGRAIWREQHPEDDCAFVIIQWQGYQEQAEDDLEQVS